MLTNKTQTAYYKMFDEKHFEGSAEVIDIILDENHSDYADYTDIGLIKFRFVNKSDTSDNSNIQFARPLSPYFKIYPIQTEVVNIFSHTSPNSQLYRGNSTYYYHTSINAWELLNLNSIPGASKFTNPNQHTIDFDENSEIKSLKPFQGDVIMSGRYGQYIRFGSSNKKFKNQWSNNSIDGNPITILTNTISDTSDKLRTEDINKDNCSIWMTTGQKIPVNPVSDNFKSYINKPTGFKEYKESQIIISSDRLLFLSKKDSIFLNSNKSISLSASDSINLDSKNDVTVESKMINLGVNSTEQAVLGNKLNTDILLPLISIITALDTLLTGGSNAITLSQINLKLNTILSNIVKLK